MRWGVDIVLCSFLLNTGSKDTPCLQHSHNLGPAYPRPVPFQPCIKTRVMCHITYSLSLRSLTASRGTCKCWRTLSSWPPIRLCPRRRRSYRRPHSATPPRPLRHRRRSVAIIIINNSCSSSAFRRRSGVAGIWTTRQVTAKHITEREYGILYPVSYKLYPVKSNMIHK